MPGRIHAKEVDVGLEQAKEAVLVTRGKELDRVPDGFVDYKGARKCLWVRGGPDAKDVRAKREPVSVVKLKRLRTHVHVLGSRQLVIGRQEAMKDRNGVHDQHNDTTDHRQPVPPKVAEHQLPLRGNVHPFFLC